jgi:hypothetical protein
LLGNREDHTAVCDGRVRSRILLEQDFEFGRVSNFVEDFVVDGIESDVQSRGLVQSAHRLAILSAGSPGAGQGVEDGAFVVGGFPEKLYSVDFGLEGLGVFRGQFFVGGQWED